MIGTYGSISAGSRFSTWSLFCSQAIDRVNTIGCLLIETIDCKNTIGRQRYGATRLRDHSQDDDDKSNVIDDDGDCNDKGDM